MSEANKRVAKQFVEAMGVGDVEMADACLAPDAQALAMGFSKLAGIRDRERMLGTLGAFKDMMVGGMHPVFHTVMAEGDRVVLEFEGNATLSNGKPYCNQYCMVMTFRDGKISLIHEYFCGVLAEQTIYPLVAAVEQ